MSKVCPICLSEFTRRPNEANNAFGLRKTCSRKCARACISEQLKVVDPPKPCVICGNTFSKREGERPFFFRQRKTCNRACAIVARTKPLDRKMPHTCGYCGGMYLVCPSRLNTSRYCSNKCRTSARAIVGPERQCTRCGETKPLAAFHRASKNVNGRNSYCIDCEAAKYDSNAERLREKARDNYRRNPTPAIAAGHRRRARMMEIEGSWTSEEWEALKARYNYTCLRCDRREPEIKLSLDHVVPVSKGGKNTIDNAQPLCRSCNSRKRTRDTDYRGIAKRGAHLG